MKERIKRSQYRGAIYSPRVFSRPKSVKQDPPICLGMITNYFKSVVLRIPPTGHAAKLGRIFMASVPPRLRNEVKVDFKLLDPAAGGQPELKVAFKDGTSVAADITSINTREMVETFDRQSRKMQLDDAIKE